MIWSFQLKWNNAIKFGYTFEILWGYKFDSTNLFKGYVDTLYQLRSKFTREHPLNLIAKLLLNSLYGRFGMDDLFSTIEIITRKEFIKNIDEYSDNNTKFVELGDKIMVIYKTHQSEVNTMLDYNKQTHNVSIAIASGITSYARIHMSYFKNNPNFKLYYTDTDSIYIDRPLPDYMVSKTILGKMKLENILKKAIFLAPKMYYLETIDGKIIYKVKGLKHEIELNLANFESLLIKQSTLEKIQTKWIKNIIEGNIQIRNDLYTLQVTNNKRKLIYNENNKLIHTIPYIIINNKEIYS